MRDVNDHPHISVKMTVAEQASSELDVLDAPCPVIRALHHGGLRRQCSQKTLLVTQPHKKTLLKFAMTI